MIIEERFPTVSDLAAAPLDDVLAAWAGLGYSRTRNLWNGAREVSAKWSGALPGRASELREVPGIGPYTAGAIASTGVDPGGPERLMRPVSVSPRSVRRDVRCADAHCIAQRLINPGPAFK